MKRIDGNLVIRGHNRGGFDVRFVPGDPAAAAAASTVRVASAERLERLLGELGVEWDRIVQIRASPYAIQSFRLRIETRAARRAGLLPTALGGLLRRVAALFHAGGRTP